MTPRVAIRNLSFLGVMLGSVVSVPAAQLKEAQVTQVVKDVKLLPTGATARPAAVSDEVREGTAVRTGAESRSELKFTDQTLARLGANTLFSFNEGTRNLNLQDGAMLLRVPKGAGGAKISSSAVTAAITGTTVMVETHALTKKNTTSNKKDGYYKFIVLEGTARLYLPGHLGESTLVKAGQMIIMRTDSKTIPEPVDVDIGKITQSSLLVTGFSTPLGSENLIAFEKTKQNEQKNSGQLYETNLVIFGAGTNVLLTDPNTVDVAVSAESNAAQSPTPTPTPTATPTPTPAPTPDKFGTPSVIASPNPYVINSGTVITTDPSITTNGVTDFGKIYRGPATDGPASAWAFGSTSTFDTSSGFDSQINSSGAAFKFTALQLAGDPTISTANGEINLGLIAVNGITSGSPGGPLTFSGIRGLLLATQNGSINLGPEISFSGLHDLTIYARGPASDLLLGSDINTSSEVHLYAERDISVTSNITTEELTAVAGRNITMSDPAIIHAGALSLTVANNGGGHIGTGGDISVTTGGDLVTTTDGIAFTIQNTAGTIDNGGNITLMTGGGISTPGAFDLVVENYDESGNPAGHIGAGGNISLTTGGNLTADSISVAVNNRNGGRIDSSANLVLNIGGALTTLHNGTDFLGGVSSLTLAISNRYENTLGSTIGGDATLLFHSDSASIGGVLSVVVSDRGGTIDGNALLNFSVTHDITVQGADDTDFQGESAATWQILTGDGPNVGSPIGGTIHGNATLLLSAANLTVPAGSLDVDIDNPNHGVVGSGGTIDSDANIAFTLTGNLTTQGDAFFGILNQLAPGGTTGGTIGGDATINVSAANISVGGALDVLINNTGGSIGGKAAINVNTGNLSGDFFASINNNTGSIASDATVNVTATSISAGAGGIDLSISDRNAGSIGGSATVNLNVIGSVTSGVGGFFVGDTFGNDGGGGGTTGSDAVVTMNAGSAATSGFFEAYNNINGGAHIHGDAINAVTVTGNLTAQQGILATIEDTGFTGSGTFGGSSHIDGNALLTLRAQSIITASTATGTPGIDTMALEASIYPNVAGVVGGDAIINVFATQNISAPGETVFWVANGNYQNLGPGNIGGNVEVNVSAANISTGDLLTQILNYGGSSIGGHAEVNITAATLSVNGSLDSKIDNTSGTIGGNAALNYSVSGTTTVTNDALFQIFGSDGATSAAININGGNYNVGGTFLGYIDGEGTSTFNNAMIAADTVKVGVFGNNGTLRIGGGIISANTLLHLYAPNGGIIDFVSDVTLNSSATAAVIAANTVTIENGVTVTISPSTSANVYTNAPNYSGSGGNNRFSGRFVGAVTTQPLGGQPPFDSPSTRVATRSARTSAAVIHVTDSSQLSSLLDNATPGPNGKIRISPDGRSRNQSVRGSTRTMVAELHRSVDAKARSGVPASRLQ